ncbi:MAG: transposase [Oscillibacter sp.]|nr:transposase [Oscillibacter sp.]
MNINMARRYGWGKGGQRVVDHAPLNTPKSTTILSSIRLDGEMAFTTFQGGATGDRFLTYLKYVLIPALRPGVDVFYLPPYSPDLNPIEKLWAKVKAILRKLRVRSLDTLDAAIRFALNCASADDCVGWFHCAGYCLF